MLELLSFFPFLTLDDAGGEGLSSPEACAGVSRGAAISAIVKIASVKSLIAYLFIRRSRFCEVVPHPSLQT
jgi:hypothetical protein